MQQTIEFQIRFDNGCLEFFEAECIQGLKRAIKMYQTNKDFWKISFTGLDNIRYRIRPKYKPQYENNEDENFWESSENKLCELSETYKNAEPGQCFWVWQLIMPEDFMERFEEIRENIYTEEEQMQNCIKNVWNEEELIEYFTKI